MEKIIRFKGLCCANCAAKLEKKLNKIKGVKATISFVAGKILLEYQTDDQFEEIILTCKKEYPDIEIRL
ncbi:MAG: heavy-metal-associated domain-containing protein [Acholeplasmatales bacterium]|nr:heavy-metal-associated domain-containing protein [Acholeplasmatales bacterium]